MIEFIPYFIVHRLAGLRHLLRQRCTAAGQLALLALVASAVLGVDIRRNLAAWIFTLLLALLLVACTGLRFRPRVRVRRDLPRFGTVGEPLRYRLDVGNEADVALVGIELAECLADPRPAAAEYRAARRQGEKPRFRWLRLLGQARLAEGARVALPELAPGTRLEVSKTLLPLRRGRLHLQGIRLVRPERLGLLTA